MIQNNRPVAINLSFKGKNIGFLAGEKKDLSHFFTPIEEFQLARQFGLIYIPDKKTVKEAEIAPNTQIDRSTKNPVIEEKLKIVSEKVEEKLETKAEKVKEKVDEIVTTAVEKFEEKEAEKSSNFHKIEFQTDTFFEKKENVTGGELVKEKVQLLEETGTKEEEKEEIFLEKPKAEKTKKSSRAKKETSSRKKKKES